MHAISAATNMLTTNPEMRWSPLTPFVCGKPLLVHVCVHCVCAGGCVFTCCLSLSWLCVCFYQPPTTTQTATGTAGQLRLVPGHRSTADYDTAINRKEILSTAFQNPNDLTGAPYCAMMNRCVLPIQHHPGRYEPQPGTAEPEYRYVLTLHRIPGHPRFPLN
jgi:hypothetical protein